MPDPPGSDAQGIGQVPTATTEIPFAELLGSLVVVNARGISSTAIYADMDVLDGALAGTRYERAEIRNRVMCDQLEPVLGCTIVGRIGQRVGAPEQGTLWMLLPGDDADTATALAHLRT